MSDLNGHHIFSERKNGDERINGLDDAKLLDFWQWAYSNVMCNSERGVFAEWLVAKAVGAAYKTRVEWDKCDIVTDDGIKIEVKSSGYLQSWHQNELSKIVFSAGETRAWNIDSNTYENVKKNVKRTYMCFAFINIKILIQLTRWIYLSGISM